MSLTSQCIVYLLPLSAYPCIASSPSRLSALSYPLTCRHCFVPHLSAYYYIPSAVGIASSLTSQHIASSLSSLSGLLNQLTWPRIAFHHLSVRCFVSLLSAFLHLAHLSVLLSCFISLTSQFIASPASALNSLFHLLAPHSA